MNYRKRQAGLPLLGFSAASEGHLTLEDSKGPETGRQRILVLGQLRLHRTHNFHTTRKTLERNTTKYAKKRQALRNADPRSKPTGIEELEEFQLLNIFFGIALSLDIAFHHLPIGTLANCGNVISIRPKFSSPKFALNGRSSSEDLSGRQTLEDLHNPPRRHFGTSTAQDMNVNFLRIGRHSYA